MTKQNSYKLTNPQKNIYQVEQQLSNSAINHIASYLKFGEVLNASVLSDTLNKLIEINDSFRLVFEHENGNLIQYFKPYSHVEIPITTLENEDISTFIESFKKYQISLENTFAFFIVITPTCSYVFFKVHHIISDAWGMTQVAEQIKEIYNKLLNNEDLSGYTKPSYMNLINREQEYLKSPNYDKDSEFWKNYVKQMESSKLFNENNLYDYSAKRFEYNLDDSLCQKISTFCQELNITEYAFFLAIISVSINKLYNKSNLVIGTPFLNRLKKYNDLNSTGLYVSTLPLYVSVSDETDFVSLCKKISNTNFSIFRHASFPFSKIQKMYNETTHSTTKIFDIGFSYQINKLSNNLNSVDKGFCNWIFLNQQNQPLNIHISTVNNYPVVMYDYLTSCLSDNAIQKINNSVINIIKQIVYEKATEISKLNILLDTDIKQLQKFNSSGNVQVPNISVIDIFNEIVQKYPTRTALICGDKTITYQELNNKINTLANILKQSNVTANDRVILILDKSIEMIVSMFAIMKVGACYIPILSDESATRTNYILENCEPKCILTHKNYDKKFNLEKNYINIDNINLCENLPYNEKNLKPNSIAYIIYTSGSTGNPKGTMVMHKNIVSLKTSIENDSILKATEKDVSMSLLKYSFDASGIDIYSSLLFGGTLLLVEKQDELNPAKVLKLIEKHKVTRSFLIPKWLEHIAVQDAKDSFDLSSLRILGTGGEILKPYILKSLLDKYKNLKILNLYGPTEATMFTTVKVITKENIKQNYSSIGRPIFGSRLGIVNTYNNFMPINTPGELIVYEDDSSIQNIAKGYLNLPEQTKKRFVKILHPLLNKEVIAYKTGDVAKINSNLEIEFIGRTDDMVKINGGYLVALNEVEQKLRQLLGNDFDICPVAIPYQNTKIIVLFIRSSNSSISLENIKIYINRNISFYMRPKKIIEIADFPRTTSGKIDKKTLAELAKDYINNHKKKIILPKNKIEQEIYKVVAHYTDVQEFSVTDDFMDDLGIDSLSLTSIYIALEKYNLNIQDLYNNPTIQELAKYISNKENNGKNYSINLDNINKAIIQNNVKPIDISNVLITGVTGFLGIHLVHELLLNPNVKKIYCIIRNKINLPAKKRFTNMISSYFPPSVKLSELIDEKITILNSDITQEYLGLDEQTYNYLQSKITCVINSAANVKHFVKPAQIKKDNVYSVDNIIKFCDKTITLAHISTLSIAGFVSSDSKDKTFDENTLYINQDLENNPYLLSKFEAEKNILIATNTQGLNAVIFRLGNIMPRKSDGKFQGNYTQNIFMSALNSIIKSGVIAKELNDFPIEFSPVDECAKFIVELLLANNKNSIYHILSNKELTISELSKILIELGYNFKNVDYNSFIEKISENSDEYTKEYISNTKLNTYTQNPTLSALKKLNLSWSTIDINYIKNILKIINKFWKDNFKWKTLKK